VQAQIYGKSYEESIEIRKAAKVLSERLNQMRAEAAAAGKQPIFNSLVNQVFSIYHDMFVDEVAGVFHLSGEPVSLNISATEGRPGEVAVSIILSRAAAESDAGQALRKALGASEPGLAGRVTAENLTEVVTLVRDLRLPYFHL
jgi:hypothetical protein